MIIAELKKDRSPQSEKTYCVLARTNKKNVHLTITMQLEQYLGKRVNFEHYQKRGEIHWQHTFHQKL